MSIGADKIVMTKQAVLGPLILQQSSKSSSQCRRQGGSVESVRGYLNLTRKELGIADTQHLTRVLLDLSRSCCSWRHISKHEQIRFLARKLLPRQVKDETNIESIVDFLCADSGSHDYTIDRREASGLGLKVEKPSHGLYDLLKKVQVTLRSYNYEQRVVCRR